MTRSIVPDLKKSVVWFLTGSQGLYGEETLRQVASEIRRLPNPNDIEAQNEICTEVTGRTLDELSQEEFDYICKCVNRY